MVSQDCVSIGQSLVGATAARATILPMVKLQNPGAPDRHRLQRRPRRGALAAHCAGARPAPACRRAARRCRDRAREMGAKKRFKYRPRTNAWCGALAGALAVGSNSRPTSREHPHRSNLAWATRIRLVALPQKLEAFVNATPAGWFEGRIEMKWHGRIRQIEAKALSKLNIRRVQESCGALDN